MKLLPVVAAMAALSASVPVIAADAGAKIGPPAELAGEFNSVNDVAFQIIDTMMLVFKKVPDIKDEASANSFVEAVAAAKPKLKALEVKLKTFPKPDDDQIEEMAKKAAGMEDEMEKGMAGMMGLMMNPENAAIAKIIQTGMEDFAKAFEGLGATLEDYYPEEKMTPLMEKHKAAGKE